MPTFKKLLGMASAISTLDRIEASEFPAVATTYNGKEIMVIAKRLTLIEIESCGKFSLINLSSDNHKGSTKDPLVESAKFAELQHNVLKICMIDPTYEEVEARILRNVNVEDFNKRMADLRQEFIFNETLDSKQVALMEKEFSMLEFRSKFFLPQDFLIDMFNFATSQDISDIKLLVSDEILFDAAIMAKKGRCRISDILCEDGEWTPHNKKDIDIRGEIVYQDRMKDGNKR